MRRLFFVLFTLCVLLAPPLAAAAEKFPSVITAAADFSEGDREKSRREARELGLRTAVLESLRAEVGQATLDDNAMVVRARFLNAYDDFVVASGVLAEVKNGFQLRVTLGYELNRTKLKLRIAALKLKPAEQRSKVLLLWSEVEFAAQTEDKLGDGAAAAEGSAAWHEGVTVPARVRDVAAALTANGFELIEPSPADRAWARTELNGREVSKQFLRSATARSDAKATIFLRVVHRRIAGPPASHLRFLRVHHVAFVFDGAKDDLAGAPVAMPVVALEGDAPGLAAPVPGEWINRVLAQLVSDAAPGVRLTVKGIGSPARFDAVWASLRKLEALGTVVPRRLTASEVVFEFANAVDDEARAALEQALPGEWKTDAAEWSVKLAPLPAPAKTKTKR